MSKVRAGEPIVLAYRSFFLQLHTSSPILVLGLVWEQMHNIPHVFYETECVKYISPIFQ